MPDDAKTADEQPTPDPAADGQGGGTPQTPTDAVTAPPAGKTFSQADVDRIAAEARKSAKADAAKLEAELQTYRKAEEQRKREQMTESERLAAERDAEKHARERAEADAASARQDALFERVLARNAAGLPEAYLRTVGGQTEEEIIASIGEARAAYEADRGSVTDGLLADIATLTPEQIAEKYGETGKALAERLKGQPVSIGAPTNAGGKPAAPHAPVTKTQELLQRAKDPKLSLVQRKAALVASMTGQQP